MAATAADILEVVSKNGLLNPGQVEEVCAQVLSQCTDVKDFARKLVQRGYLTVYQVNQIAKGKAKDLILGQYVLLDMLGEGGMGAVYRARHRRLERIVALKVIKKEALSIPTAVERFQREARAAARLEHPNIVTVHDADEANGVHFMAMQYIEGTDLSKLVKEKGRLPVGQACEYVRQAALGLQHAHEQGMVHRDIKPANLMLTKGTVKVLDMGLARLRGGQRTELTATGTIMGTPDFLSPEQGLNSKDVDIRSDIYSLGCSLYYFLAGETPFVGDEVTEKLIKHQLHEPPAIESLRDDLPKGLAKVVRKMMAKKPEDRYQTPGEAADALAPFAEEVSREKVLPPAKQQQTPAMGGPPTKALNKVSPGEPSSRTLDYRATKAPGPNKRKLMILGGALAGIVLLVIVIGSLIGPTDGDKKNENTPPTVAKDNGKQKPPVPAPFKPNPNKEYITNSIGMKLVKIPAGKFVMGSGRPGRPDECPLHEVVITKDFYMGVFEVTQDQYEQVMLTNPSHFSPMRKGSDLVAEFDTRTFPVDYVSQVDAVAFCKKLSEMPDEKKEGRVYRLPTEAEWEYACRAGTTTAFHYGDSLSLKQANFSGNPRSVEKGPVLGRTTTVGSYKPNAFGLHDMHGNVDEWCADLYGGKYYAESPKEDPKGPTPGGRPVVRGGCWKSYGDTCRSAFRGRNIVRTNFYGFRVVLLLPAK